MSHGIHRARRRWFIGLLPTIWVVIGVATAAAALWFTIVNVTGRIAVADFGVEITAQPVVEAGSCTLSSWSVDTFTFDWGGAAPGATCTILVNMKRTSAIEPYLQDFIYAAADGAVLMSAPGACGLQPPAVAGPTGDVHITFTVTEDSSPSQLLNFVAGDGFEFVRAADYDPANCGL